MSASEWVHLEVAEILRETVDTFLLHLEGGEEVWVPKSQVADANDYKAGDGYCTISVTRWLADQKGLG
jgi:hypothetical protein